MSSDIAMQTLQPRGMCRAKAGDATHFFKVSTELRTDFKDKIYSSQGPLSHRVSYAKVGCEGYPVLTNHFWSYDKGNDSK